MSKLVAEVMHTPAPAVSPDMSVKAFYDWIAEQKLDGAAVVDGGRLIGVVTSMDLVFRDKALHVPTVFAFLDAMIPIGIDQTADELRKLTGATVGDICTREVVKVSSDVQVHDVATLMVTRHLSIVPVVDGGELVGLVTKDDVLRAHFGR